MSKLLTKNDKTMYFKIFIKKDTTFIIFSCIYGVHIRLLVDGMESWIDMEGNPYFYGLSQRVLERGDAL